MGLSMLRAALKLPSMAKSFLRYGTFHQFLKKSFFSKLGSVVDHATRADMGTRAVAQSRGTGLDQKNSENSQYSLEYS